MISLSTRGETEKNNTWATQKPSVFDGRAWEMNCIVHLREGPLKCVPTSSSPGVASRTLISEPSLLHTESVAHVCSLHLWRTFLGKAYGVDTRSRWNLLLQRSRRLVAKVLTAPWIWDYPWPHPESKLHSCLSAPGVSPPVSCQGHLLNLSSAVVTLVFSKSQLFP